MMLPRNYPTRPDRSRSRVQSYRLYPRIVRCSIAVRLWWQVQLGFLHFLVSHQVPPELFSVMVPRVAQAVSIAGFDRQEWQ